MGPHRHQIRVRVLSRWKPLKGQVVAEMPEWKYPPESGANSPGKTSRKIRPAEVSRHGPGFKKPTTGWKNAMSQPPTNLTARPLLSLVFQDGDAYKKELVGTVVDNLIASNAMPVTILLLLNPGVNDDGSSNRSVEYGSTWLSAKLRVCSSKRRQSPRAGKDYLSPPEAKDPRDRRARPVRGGIFFASRPAWERPDLFGRVCSQIGSFTNIRGGNAYPQLIRDSPARPIKVFLQDGTNDLINLAGDWWQANEADDAAPAPRGYDVSFLRDRGFHAYWSCGIRLPECLRRPGPPSNRERPNTLGAGFIRPTAEYHRCEYRNIRSPT